MLEVYFSGEIGGSVWELVGSFARGSVGEMAGIMVESGCQEGT